MNTKIVKYLITLTAVLCCTMTAAVLTACTDTIDNPSAPAEEPAVVDNGKWHVTEEIMDKTVRPGDDFFMYCVGGYWKNTVVDDNTPFKMLFLQQIIDEMKRLLAPMTLPSIEKTLADADKNDDATIKAQKASQEQTLFDDIRAIRRAKMNLIRKLTGMPTQRAGFHQVILEEMPLTEVNSCYMPSGNYMNIFPAFMMAPFVDPQQNAAHNYANLRNGMMGCAEGALTDETGITTQFACHAVYLGGF